MIAEHFFYKGVQRPRLLGERPVMMHSLDLSLGSDAALDEEYLEKLQQAQTALSPVLLSDHLCFTQSGGIELGHLNPIPPTKAVAARVASKIREAKERTGALFLLESILTHLSISGDLHAREFYRRVCKDADCGMLLDVTNILVNCHNFKKDPIAFIEELDLSRVVQLHAVEYTTGHDGTRFDSHTENTNDDVFALCQEVISRAPVKAVIIERDGNYPEPERLLYEVDRLQNMIDE
ncbi:MAG: DUF692 domain-containing protein [Deltaproteobacteria bacterium]|nr:DUF692 domain-containing protein [Deltaproteobacteria bacterium]